MHKSLNKQLHRLNINDQESFMDHHRFIKYMTLISDKHPDEETLKLLQNSQKASTKSIRSICRQLEEKNAKYLEAIVAAMPDLMFLVDTNGKYLDVFDTGKEDLLYKPKDEIIGKNITDFFNPEIADQLLSLVRKAQETQILQHLEYELFFTSEKEYFEARVMPTHLKESDVDTVMVIVRDITREKKQDDISRIIETVFEEATEGIIIEDTQRNVIHANPAMVRILNISKENLIGKHSDYLSNMLTPETQESIYTAITAEGHWYGEVEITRYDQKTILAWLTIDVVFDNASNPVNTVIMVTDISEIHLSRKRMEHLATHDSLTNLPNRTLMFEYLNHAISTAKRIGTKGALLFIDIDGFKAINDNYSHRTGDLLLQNFALRLSKATRKSDIAGRLSGDEFLLILENIRSMDDLPSIVKKIKTLFTTPFSINELTIDITISIGIALFPTDGDDADQLIHAADQAMYNVKKNGKNSFAFYTKEFSTISNEYFLIQSALKRAIREDDFSILYQPQFSLVDGSLKGVEALLRCNDPELTDIPISRLLSIAEENNIIHGISRLVMDKCCRQIQEWQALSLSPLKIAVNLSRKELSDEDLVDVIKGNLSECCIDPKILEFELTESTLLQNNRTAKKNISELHELGCSFSIDDYGTGFSSLSYLREFDLDKIKIDKSFIEGLEHNDNDKIIVSATINMVKQLGLTVLAEGVESKGQEALLKKFGCDEVQGYLYSCPLNAEKITELLASI